MKKEIEKLNKQLIGVKEEERRKEEERKRQKKEECKKRITAV